MPDSQEDIPMSSGQLNELLKIYSRFPKEAAWPFIPYKGSCYADPSLDNRVMFVGKATYGWGDVGEDPSKDRPGLKALSAKFVVKKVIPRGYRSAFWRYLHDVTVAIHGYSNSDGNQGDSWDWAMRRLVWSNLAKVGSRDGNPSGALWKAQEHLLVDTLRREVEEYRPTHLVLCVGAWGWDQLTQCFGAEENWDGWKNTTWHLWSSEFNCHVIWTRHPQGWETQDRKDTIARIVELPGDRQRDCV